MMERGERERRKKVWHPNVMWIGMFVGRRILFLGERKKERERRNKRGKKKWGDNLLASVLCDTLTFFLHLFLHHFLLSFSLSFIFLLSFESIPPFGTSIRTNNRVSGKRRKRGGGWEISGKRWKRETEWEERRNRREKKVVWKEEEMNVMLVSRRRSEQFTCYCSSSLFQAIHPSFFSFSFFSLLSSLAFLSSSFSSLFILFHSPSFLSLPSFFAIIFLP